MNWLCRRWFYCFCACLDIFSHSIRCPWIYVKCMFPPFRRPFSICSACRSVSPTIYHAYLPFPEPRYLLATLSILINLINVDLHSSIYNCYSTCPRPWYHCQFIIARAPAVTQCSQFPNTFRFHYSTDSLSFLFVDYHFCAGCLLFHRLISLPQGTEVGLP